MNQERGRRNDRRADATEEVQFLLERSARHFPADLPPHHYARRTGWRTELRWITDGFVRYAPDELAGLEPLPRQLEAARAQAESMLVAERLGDALLNAQQREELTRRALGILPTDEADRLREVFACSELEPRRFARSAESTLTAFSRIENCLGPGTALAYCMLVIAGLRKEEELVQYGERLDEVFTRVVSAPRVVQALEEDGTRTDADGQGQTRGRQFGLLGALRDELWTQKPRRVSSEFLLTQVIDNWLSSRSGVGNSLGLAILDSIVLGKLGFRVNYLVESDVLRLEVQAEGRSVYWELTDGQPLASVPAAKSRPIALRELFAVTYGSLATMCFARGMYDRAVESYRLNLELIPISAEARISLAICLMRQQRPQEAVSELQVCLELDRNLPEAHHQLGNAYTMLGDWPKAIESHKRAIRLRPDTAEVYNNLGFAYLRAGIPTQAIAAFEAAIEHRPGYYEAHFNLANLYAEQSQHDLAVRHYREALRIQPGSVPAHYNLGRTLYEKHDLDGAIRCYQKAVNLDPKHFGAWHNLGIAYRDKGQKERAVEALERAVTLNPNLMR